MRKNLHKLTQLSSQFSPKIRIFFRCNMKHSEECFITYPNTSKCVKKTRLRLVFSTHFSVFGYVMKVKHSSSCFIYYIMLGKSFFFFFQSFFGTAHVFNHVMKNTRRKRNGAVHLSQEQRQNEIRAATRALVGVVV